MQDSLAMEGDGDFSCLSAREIMSKSTAELRSLVHDRREKRKRKRLDFEEKLAKVGYVARNQSNVAAISVLCRLAQAMQRRISKLLRHIDRGLGKLCWRLV